MSTQKSFIWQDIEWSSTHHNIRCKLFAGLVNKIWFYMIDFVEVCHGMRQNRCILGACSGTHREQNTAPIVKIFIPDHLHTWRLTQKKSDQKILNRNIFSGPVITAAFARIFYKSETSTGFTLVSTINETWAEKLKMSLGRTGSGVWSSYHTDL